MDVLRSECEGISGVVTNERLKVMIQLRPGTGFKFLKNELDAPTLGLAEADTSLTEHKS